MGRATLIGLIVGAVIALLIPSSYKATARLMPPDNQSSTGMMMLAALTSKVGLPAAAATDVLGMKSSGAVFVAVLRSRTVGDSLINRFDLRKVYWHKTYEDTREELEDNTDISEDRKSGVITIVVDDHDRDRAAALAQAYVDELDKLVAKLTTSSAHRERVFLEQRLEVVKGELDTAVRDLGQFSSKNTAVDIKEQGKAMVEAAATLQGQLIAAQAQLSGLEQIYSNQNVRVRSLKARIAELQSQLQKLGGKTPTTEGVTLSPSSEQMYPSIRELPILGIQYAQLYRRAKIQEVVFEILTQQYELAKVSEAKEIPTVKLLDRPARPEKKSFPPRILLTIAGGLLGFCIMGAFIFGVELWREVDDVEPHKAFAVQVWSEAGAARSLRSAWARRIGWHWPRLGRGSGGNGQPSAGGDNGQSSADDHDGQRSTGDDNGQRRAADRIGERTE